MTRSASSTRRLPLHTWVGFKQERALEPNDTAPTGQDATLYRDTDILLFSPRETRAEATEDKSGSFQEKG